MSPKIDLSVFKKCVWKEFYGDLKDLLAPNAPKSWGKDIYLRL
jgi:hypothetical protein